MESNFQYQQQDGYVTVQLTCLLSLLKIILDCVNVELNSPVTDVSSRCSKLATPKNCKNIGYVRKRCQASCGVCEGSKFFYQNGRRGFKISDFLSKFKQIITFSLYLNC